MAKSPPSPFIGSQTAPTSTLPRSPLSSIRVDCKIRWRGWKDSRYSSLPFGDVRAAGYNKSEHVKTMTPSLGRRGCTHLWASASIASIPTSV
ncbi:hypothetical protein J3R82DRAFT_9046 [Butyriboletus roseoflavus]|nr:hypothetical protein J3R82DRAFT_9046 [Butyriboletus roseoflavus]